MDEQPRPDGASQDPYRLGVIVGSIREGRFAPVVTRWFVGRAEQRRDLTVDVIDLAEGPQAAARQAHSPPAGEDNSEEDGGFAARVSAADAFVVVTPEYNHAYPGSLKLAIDSAHREWHAKPVGFVCYGGVSGGLRAVERLRAVFAELHAVTIRETVSFHMAAAQFDEHGRPREPEAVNEAARVLLDQLGWWAHTLRNARAARPYPA